MATRNLTSEQIAFIIDNRLIMSGTDIDNVLGLSRGSTGLYMRQNGLVVSRELQLSFRKNAMIGKTSSTPEMDKIIIDNYLSIPSKRLAKMLNKSDCFVRGRMRQLQLVIPPEIVEQRKLNSRIQPGTIPPNKGKKQTEYMSPEAIARTLGSRFKKGNINHNTHPDGDGAITIRQRKQDRFAYKFIRIKKSKWEFLHRHVWEQNHGSIPKEHVVIFKDGNTMNCDINNLDIISYEENMRRNSIHRYPEELKEVIRLTGKLNKKLTKLKENGTEPSNK